MRVRKLSEYINLLNDKNLLVKVCGDVPDADVTCLTYDTRSLDGQALFVCKGAHFKKEYLLYALENGAVCYVSEVEYDVGAPALIVSDIREAMPALAGLFFDGAQNKITSVAITGTKGKSTTAYYLRSVIDEYMSDIGGKKCAVVSSIDTYDGVVNEESHLTTPEAIELYRHFYNAERSGITHLVMEASSQALKYKRAAGITFDVACFTNIGSDHISPVEHADAEDYYASKLKIFDSCKCACVNTDAERAEETLDYARKRCRVITYGSDERDDVYISGIEKRADGIYFNARTPEYEREMCITMPGLFNVSNAAAVIAVSLALNIPEKYVASGLKKARASGRMQLYSSRDGEVEVIVDYAHNEMSFRALFDSVKEEFPMRRIIAVFGSAGGKAHLRRRDLPQIAGATADKIIITEEDPGDEPLENISADIARNVPERCAYEIIDDRGEAVRRAINDFPGEKRLVIITGKGEETRQKRGTEYVECPSDAEYTLRYLSEYDKAALTAN